MGGGGVPKWGGAYDKLRGGGGPRGTPWVPGWGCEEGSCAWGKEWFWGGGHWEDVGEWVWGFKRGA